MKPIAVQYVEMRKNRRGLERPVIAGTRVRIQDVASDYERHGMTAEEIVREFPHLSLAQVHAALSYYFDHRDQIWNALKEDAAFAEQLKQQQKLEQRTTRSDSGEGNSGDGNSISS